MSTGGLNQPALSPCSIFPTISCLLGRRSFLRQGQKYPYMQCKMKSPLMFVAIENYNWFTYKIPISMQEPHHKGRARARQVSRGGAAGQQPRLLGGVGVPQRQRHEPRREVRHVVTRKRTKHSLRFYFSEKPTVKIHSYLCRGAVNILMREKNHRVRCCFLPTLFTERPVCSEAHLY